MPYRQSSQYLCKYSLKRHLQKCFTSHQAPEQIKQEIQTFKQQLFKVSGYTLNQKDIEEVFAELVFG